ncbi:hypothetical protein K439DRAFT_515186 [Ramaria rubella]|nr:hypothetical protein K439DRAFT_515186 [Ramaria rubella]
MSASEDEYDVQAGGAIELSAEDCAKIDASSAGGIGHHVTTTQPVLHINHVTEDAGIRRTTKSPIIKIPNHEAKKISPFKRFRPSGHLSVTDLISPSWCEVQFDYGLQQRRSRKIEKRPESFITREGKEIRVEKKTAQLNDVILREGHAVHTALEHELHPVQVQVHTTTQEEEWGLRLFNMLSGIETLMLVGKCREFPVMGFIHNHLVFGIIDEINRTSVLDEPTGSESLKRPSDTSTPCTPRKGNRKRAKPGTGSLSPERLLKLNTISSRHWHVTDNEATSSLRATVIRRGRTHTLRLLDSKTRLSTSLPQHEATLSSRLQLMTYKRLLDALTSSLPPFDFDHLWGRLGIESQRLFSSSFLEQLYPFYKPERYEIECLKDLEKGWQAAVELLGVREAEGQIEESANPVHDELTLVYRLRAAGPSTRIATDDDVENALKGRYVGLSSQPEIVHDAVPLEQSQFLVTAGGQDAIIGTTVKEGVNTLEAFQKTDIQDSELDWAIRESLKLTSTLPQKKENASGEADGDHNNKNIICEQKSHLVDITLPLASKLAHMPGDIIGRKKFKHDNSMLDAHLTNVLQWWHGEREPYGVSIENSSRCYTCEYMSGCEWREKKASKELERGWRKEKGKVERGQ